MIVGGVVFLSCGSGGGTDVDAAGGVAGGPGTDGGGGSGGVPEGEPADTGAGSPRGGLRRRAVHGSVRGAGCSGPVTWGVVAGDGVAVRGGPDGSGGRG